MFTQGPHKHTVTPSDLKLVISFLSVIQTANVCKCMEMKYPLHSSLKPNTTAPNKDKESLACLTRTPLKITLPR